jgi:hypothetical protein
MSKPVLQLLQGDRILRFEQLPSGRLRRLVEDKRGIASTGQTGCFIETNFAQIEMRFYDMMMRQR